MIEKNIFDEINQKKLKLDELRPLSEETVKSLRESVLLEWTYNSNAIEGNTLTLLETKVVLEGITVGGKSLREHLEVCIATFFSSTLAFLKSTTIFS